MFEVFSNVSQTLPQNSAISFETIKFEDCRIALSNDGRTITIKAPGKYLLHFDGIGNSTVVDSPLEIQLFVDGTAQPCARTITTTTVADGTEAISFDTLVQVKPSCCCSSGAQTFQLMNVSTDPGVITHANVVIIHL